MATQSTAPISIALIVIAAPRSVSDDTMMTGSGRSRITFSRNSRPFMLRHLDVERHDVGIERLDRLARLQRIGGLADDRDRRDRRRASREISAAHRGGIVDDEDADGLHRACDSA